MAEIDWELWSRIDSARVCDLVALCAGINPQSLLHFPKPKHYWGGGHRVDLPLDCPSGQKAEYERRIQLVRSALKARTLAQISGLDAAYPDSTECLVLEFVKWSAGKALALPSGLLNHVSVQAWMKATAATQQEGVEEPSASQPRVEDRVYSWVSILEYLGKRLNRMVLQRTARNWIKKQELPLMKDGNGVFMLKSDLDRLSPPASSR